MNPITAYRAAKCDRIMREQYGGRCANPEDHALRFDPERHAIALLVLALLAGLIIGLLTANIVWVPGHGYVTL